jgi:hypothetical protein
LPIPAKGNGLQTVILISVELLIAERGARNIAYHG